MKNSLNSRQVKSSHALRGKRLEKNLNQLCRQIQALGYHAHKNHPNRTYSGKFISGEPFDYEIFTDRFKWCFDAKECNSDRWSLSNAKISQINALKQCKNAGLDAFFLVYFYPSQKLIRFDVDLIIDTDKKSLAPEDGVQVNLNELFN